MSRKTEEGKVQQDIINHVNYLEELGNPIFYERRQAGGFNYKKGIPDLFVVYNGIHIEVEVKKPGGEQSSMQEKFERRCKNKYNCPYICVDNLKEFINYLDKIIRKGI